MKLDFNNIDLREQIFSAEFGLEKESLRVDGRGFLSHTKHPFGDNPNIQRDFCESQTEFVTDVFNSSVEVCAHLRELHKYAAEKLSALPSGSEYLWCFSNPPYIRSESEIPIAEFRGAMKGKRLYRQYLAEKYGKMKMMYSGIHLNFSFSESLLRKCFEDEDNRTFTEFKNGVYLKLAKGLVNYSWLIVYLTAASPVADGSFFDERELGKDVFTGYSSARCSEIGYWNDFIPILSYDDLESYVASIAEYVDSNRIRSVSELYYPIRLKPRGENSLENLLANGVNHIELRMLDNNPLSPIGIFEDDIDFIHLLIIYLISQNDFDLDSDMQINAINNEKASAYYDDGKIINFDNSTLSLKAQALNVLAKIESFFEDCIRAKGIIFRQKQKLLNTNGRYAEIVAERFGKNYVQNGLRLAKEYAGFFEGR